MGVAPQGHRISSKNFSILCLDHRLLNGKGIFEKQQILNFAKKIGAPLAERQRRLPQWIIGAHSQIRNTNLMISRTNPGR